MQSPLTTQALHLRGDDDFVDRLNYYYASLPFPETFLQTPIMLSIACLVISAKQVGPVPYELLFSMGGHPSSAG